MHNVIRIMVMIAAVCLFFRLQKCSVDGKEHSDNSEEFFRYLKMRQRTTHDKSSQKPFPRYQEEQLFKSNHSSTISKLPASSFHIIDDADNDDDDNDGKFKWPLIDVTSSTRPHFRLKKDHCFVTRFEFKYIRSINTSMFCKEF